ncbi:MAG: DUF3791 domain-containing protein [Treponemataceae bacterium]|nr:DUF3791 domain-containing protein [Treponemataceae bacterium]
MEHEDMAFWLSWCIEEYAAKKQLVNTEVAALFETHDVLTYLSDNAEILHTQGRSYILSAIDDFLAHDADGAEHCR